MNRREQQIDQIKNKFAVKVIEGDCFDPSLNRCILSKSGICIICPLDHGQLFDPDLDKKKQVDSSTIEKIELLFNNFKEFLKEKNIKYGDAALSPIMIFNKIDSNESIYSRLDDKLSRIQNSNELRKNDVADLFGYLALLMLNKGWTDFNDLLD